MEYGVCGGPDIADAAASAGFDFVEWQVARLLCPTEADDVFEAALAQVREAALPCPVLNCFVPADHKITGPSVDSAALQAFAAKAFERAELAGVDVIVFGSGGARRIPEGFDRTAAREQLVAFCRMCGPLAQAHGVTVVVEPLNTGDCNVLTSVGESAALVRDADHPNVRLLVDGYHWAKDNDSLEDVAASMELFRHVHIATYESRLAPGLEPCDFGPFFGALRTGGYAGRVSIEAKVPNPERDLPKALEVLTSPAQGLGG